MAEQPTFTSIRRDLQAGHPAPVYLIHGEEGYYIDTLVKDFEALIPEADRSFDLSVMYTPDIANPRAIEMQCRSLPFLGERKVVIVKEAQTASADFFKPLAPYIAKPNPTTTLCLCFRGEKAKGAELLKAVRGNKDAVNFEAVKIKEGQVGALVQQFIKERKLGVEPKALLMLSEYVGTDLSRLYNEVDKLTVSLGEGSTITPESVERNIGVSKEYNAFELVKALAEKDTPKVLAIYYNYRANPKAHPVQQLMPLIFNLFSNLLAAQYSADKTDRGLMQELGFSSPWQLKDVKAAMSRFNAWNTIEILDKIRQTECASKGAGSRQDPYDLLFDLLIHILNPIGAAAVRR